MGFLDPRVSSDFSPSLRPHETDSRPPLALALGASGLLLTSGAGAGRKREVKVWSGAGSEGPPTLLHTEEFDSAPGLLYPVRSAGCELLPLLLAGVWRRV